MAWTNGIFSRIHNWIADRDAGIAMLASRHDNEDDNLAAGINNCLTKDGQNTPIATLPMAGFRHTGAGVGVDGSDYSTMSQTFLVDGTSTMSGAINAGGFKVVNAAVATNANDRDGETKPCHR